MSNLAMTSPSAQCKSSPLHNRGRKQPQGSSLKEAASRKQPQGSSLKEAASRKQPQGSSLKEAASLRLHQLRAPSAESTATLGDTCR
ncbi:hypothetical protein EYF80_067864 [Liparis tanakae]|uniref:Uncharacterized protein n=1 Tax=Liparis tanakae TaxID=230148 RepID=A0A4Z2DZQ5_9TELE|nr:hypothetical protein EYF80_067864 [Liparis tanakae]